MKKLLSVVLGAMLIAVSALSIVACGKSSGLSAIEALAEKGIYIDSVPSVFFPMSRTRSAPTNLSFTARMPSP